MPQPSSDFDFASVLREGDHVIWPQGTGEPCGLSSTLIAAAPRLPAFTLVVGMIASRTLAGVPAIVKENLEEGALILEGETPA